MGKFLQFLTEGFDDSPYYPTTLPLSKYRGVSNPLNDDQPYGAEFYDVTKLWDIVEDQIEHGVEPYSGLIQMLGTYATQDWLSTESGDEALFPDYADKPVILYYKGVKYILDGHNRIARAQKKGARSFDGYMFNWDN